MRDVSIYSESGELEAIISRTSLPTALRNGTIILVDTSTYGPRYVLTTYGDSLLREEG